MIVVTRSRRGIPYIQKWFAREAQPVDSIRFVVYYQYLGDRPALFLFKRSFTTLLVDLGMGAESIFAGMHRNVRNEIRRADTEGISWETGFAVAEFLDFHARFTREKGIGAVTGNQLASFGDALFLSRVAREDRVLAQHAYIVDSSEQRARFLYSSSGRFEGAESALVGRANRWAHWKDMLHFREKGIATYDFGGISTEKEDAALRGINEFKLRFGGRAVREEHLYSAPYALALRLAGLGIP